MKAASKLDDISDIDTVYTDLDLGDIAADLKIMDLNETNYIIFKTKIQLFYFSSIYEIIYIEF